MKTRRTNSPGNYDRGRLGPGRTTSKPPLGERVVQCKCTATVHNDPLSMIAHVLHACPRATDQDRHKARQAYLTIQRRFGKKKTFNKGRHR